MNSFDMSFLKVGVVAGLELFSGPGMWFFLEWLAELKFKSQKLKCKSPAIVGLYSICSVIRLGDFSGRKFAMKIMSGKITNQFCGRQI